MVVAAGEEWIFGAWHVPEDLVRTPRHTCSGCRWVPDVSRGAEALQDQFGDLPRCAAGNRHVAVYRENSRYRRVIKAQRHNTIAFEGKQNVAELATFEISLSIVGIDALGYNDEAHAGKNEFFVEIQCISQFALCFSESKPMACFGLRDQCRPAGVGVKQSDAARRVSGPCHLRRTSSAVNYVLRQRDVPHSRRI